MPAYRRLGGVWTALTSPAFHRVNGIWTRVDVYRRIAGSWLNTLPVGTPGGGGDPGTTTPPFISFIANTYSGLSPLPVLFTDTSNIAGTNWRWTFGDGGISTVKDPSHTYTTPGQYTVTLTVSDASGVLGTSSNTVLVTAKAATYDVALFDQDVYASLATTPAAPSIVSATSTGVASATVTWSAPGADGGTPITGYRLSRDGTSSTGAGAFSTVVPATARAYTFTQLVSGATYTITVTAINTIGESPVVSTGVTVAAAQLSSTPSMPTGGLVYAVSTSQATIAWSPPVTDGASPITGYRVSRDGVATSGTGAFSTLLAPTARTYTMNLLRAGGTYNLSVAAVNGQGDGPAFTGAVDIPTVAPTVIVPSVPLTVVRTSGSASTATITWTAPTSTGGSAVTSYRVSRDGLDGGQVVNLAATATSYTFTGLQPATLYFLSVAAVNSAGVGPASIDDVTVLASATGPTVPTIPTGVTTSSPSTSQATINWAPPASDGGSPITGYRVSRNGSSSSGSGAFSTVVAATVRSYTMNLLLPGTAYTLSVSAINAVGGGPVASSTLTVGSVSNTLPTIPLSVTRSSPTTSTAVINWAPPASDGGNAITGYRVSRDGTSSTGTGAFTTIVAATTRTFSFGLMVAGTTYNLSVAAINVVGEGPASTGPVVIGGATTPGTPTPTPSGTTVPTLDLKDYTLLFTDDFNTAAPLGQFLTKYPTWRAYPNTYPDTSGNGTYDPAVISVANSIMDMWIHHDATSGQFKVAAPEPRINGATGARGQKYGRYEVRWRIPTAAPGYKVAWLLWPDSGLSAEGELDFPEGNLTTTSTIQAYSHDVQGTHSHNAFASNTGVLMIGSAWHTTTIEWRPTGVTFFIDGRNLGTTPALGTPVTAMHWILQTETALSSTAPATSSATHVQVDWVAVWKYTPGTAAETPTDPAPLPPPPTDPVPPPPTPTPVPTPTPTTPTLNTRVVGVGGYLSTRTTNATSVRIKVSTDAAGTAGVVYSPAAVPNGQGWAQHRVTGLTAGTMYYYRVAMTNLTGPETLDTSTLAGQFRMPPTAATSFSFCFSSCNKVADSAAMAAAAARTDDMFLHLGDLWYADGSGVNLANYRAKMQGQLTSANHQALIANTPFVYTPSDHDLGMNNNAMGGTATAARDYFNQVYREMVPAPVVPATTGVYRTFTWGRARFIVADLRSFKGGSTAMGATQKQWFKDVITAATEPLIFFLSETPWNSPTSTGDDDWGSFSAERTELVNHVAAAGKASRMVVLAGDMHALAYDSGANSPGGWRIFHSSPLNQSASIKGGTFSGGVYPASGTTVVQQYSRIVVTDTGGATITVAFTGYSSDNTVRKSYTFNITV